LHSEIGKRLHVINKTLPIYIYIKTVQTVDFGSIDLKTLSISSL